MSRTDIDGGDTIGTVGAIGNEGGEIVKDEELSSCARITLEELPKGHYAVTCGIYGAMVHTAYFGKEDAFSKYEEMKSDIEAISLQENDDEFYRLIEEFVDKY